jgi:hypothetical protein
LVLTICDGNYASLEIKYAGGAASQSWENAWNSLAFV